MRAKSSRLGSGQHGDEWSGLEEASNEASLNAEVVVLWLDDDDDDREGEAICFIDVSLENNKDLEFKRAKFSAMTQTDIEVAIFDRS